MSISVKSKQKLGKEIKKQREKTKLSQRKLAAICGITPQALSDIENGVNFPSVDVFMKLVENANFTNKEKMYDLYGELKETIPPDLLSFLIDNKDVVTELRQKIKQAEGAI